MKINFLIAILFVTHLVKSQSPKIIGEITSKNLQEVSGMMQYSYNKDFFWTHNDSGDDAKIYLTSKSGALMCTYILNGINAIDWEDMTILRENGKNYLIIGDIGDNTAIRKHLTLYKIEEPEWDNLSSVLTIDNIESMTIKYLEGARDAETLMTNPVTGEMIIISKREEVNMVYQFPFENNSNIEIAHIGQLPIKMLTSGDISQSGGILLKNYNNIYLFPAKPGFDISAMLSGDWINVPYVPEPQGESITWDANGKIFYTTSEKRYQVSRQFIIEYSLDQNIR